MQRDCLNLIGGQFVSAIGGEQFENRCPADGALIGTAPASGEADMLAAIDAAERGFPKWASVPAPKRGDLIRKVATLLEEHQAEVAKALAEEEGKVYPEALGEVLKTLKYIRYAAGDARRMAGITVPSELPGTFACTQWRPRGVIGLITPWNFPVCIPFWS